MSIQLTAAQWDDLQRQQQPARVSDPSHESTFVLVRSDVYEHFKSLFEADPVCEQERLFHLQQFGRRAGWDDPEMDVYNDPVMTSCDELDPREHPKGGQKWARIGSVLGRNRVKLGAKWAETGARQDCARFAPCRAVTCVLAACFERPERRAGV